MHLVQRGLHFTVLSVIPAKTLVCTRWCHKLVFLSRTMCEDRNYFKFQHVVLVSCDFVLHFNSTEGVPVVSVYAQDERNVTSRMTTSLILAAVEVCLPCSSVPGRNSIEFYWPSFISRNASTLSVTAKLCDWTVSLLFTNSSRMWLTNCYICKMLIIIHF